MFDTFLAGAFLTDDFLTDDDEPNDARQAKSPGLFRQIAGRMDASPEGWQRCDRIAAMGLL